MSYRGHTSAGEVLGEALPLMHEKDELRATRLGELRQEIKAGLDSGPTRSRVGVRSGRRGTGPRSDSLSSLAAAARRVTMLSFAA